MGPCGKQSEQCLAQSQYSVTVLSSAVITINLQAAAVRELQKYRDVWSGHTARALMGEWSHVTGFVPGREQKWCMSFQATVPRVLLSLRHGGCFVSVVPGSDGGDTRTPPPPPTVHAVRV